MVDGLIEHIKKLYLQVNTWYGVKLTPLEWGWELENGQLSPVTMTQKAGPPDIFSTFSCSCIRSREGVGAAEIG